MSRRRADIVEPPISAKTGCEQSQQNLRLFDHLVGAGEQRGRGDRMRRRLPPSAGHQ
jgi:hypothetical protein